MEPIHIFYKELPVDENNIFTANIAEENEVEEVRFKKSKEYAVIGLPINQDINCSLAAVTDTDRQEAISNFIQKLVKEKKDPDLDLRIYNEEVFEKIIPFKKKTKSEIPPMQLTFYNTTTKIQEEVEFYNYMLHLEKYGLGWEDSSLEFKYLVDCQLIKKGLIKK